MPTTKASRDFTAEIAYLTRALKAPTLRQSVDRLVERATAEAWSYPEFLAACLQREVSARESHGGEGRIRAARFPARKSLEEFDYDHARGLKRESIAHLGTPDFVTAKDNVVSSARLGPARRNWRSGWRSAPSRTPGPVQHRRPMGHPARRRPPRRTAASRAHPAGPLPADRGRRGRLHPLRT